MHASMRETVGLARPGASNPKESQVGKLPEDETSSRTAVKVVYGNCDDVREKSLCFNDVLPVCYGGFRTKQS